MDSQELVETRSQELVVTRSFNTSDFSVQGQGQEEDIVHISESEVPSHFRLMLMEISSCRNKGIRRVKSRGAILVLLVTCMVNISFNGALGDILGKFFREIFHLNHAGILSALGIVFVRTIPQLAYPLAGWVADVHYGRFKVILASLRLMLFGYIIIFIAFLVRFFYETEAGKYVVYLGIFPVAFLAINTGLAAFQANIIPFGLDQMPHSSTDELSAFIHWYYGSRNILAGIVPLIACYISEFELTTVVISSCEVSCIGFALFLCYTFKTTLILEPISVNPFKLLYGVLKFAIKNKTPIYRSAFTYWEDDIPSRINLGKTKYGGPFSNEEVEDVKTFIRTTGVLVSASVFMIGYYTMLVSN